MLNILNELYETGTFASFYTNFEKQDYFHFGKIIALNENNVALQLLDTDGQDDGVMIMDVNNIFRVELNGQYYNKMRKLFSPEKIVDYDFKIEKGDDIIKSVLSHATLNKVIVSIELCESGYNNIVGFVLEINGNECKALLIDDYGEEDGYTYFSTDCISSMAYSRKEEKIIQLLYNCNTGDGSVCD